MIPWVYRTLVARWGPDRWCAFCTVYIRSDVWLGISLTLTWPPGVYRRLVASVYKVLCRRDVWLGMGLTATIIPKTEEDNFGYAWTNDLWSCEYSRGTAHCLISSTNYYMQHVEFTAISKYTYKTKGISKRSWYWFDILNLSWESVRESALGF